MSQPERSPLKRVLILITSPKLAGKATAMLHSGAVPVHYCLHAEGTVSGEMLDILGLGSIDRTVLISIMPKLFADKFLHKLKKELKIGTINSGIAFTLPISGANNLILRMLKQLDDEDLIPPERKEVTVMADVKHTMIAAVINQGYSEEVMNAARAAGAGGGTVLHSRRIGDKEAMSFWGFSVQEEKEIVLIVADVSSKLKIMQAIGEQCGMHSEAKGIVLSLPIDTVIGLDED